MIYSWYTAIHEWWFIFGYPFKCVNPPSSKYWFITIPQCGFIGIACISYTRPCLACPSRCRHCPSHLSPCPDRVGTRALQSAQRRSFQTWWLVCTSGYGITAAAKFEPRECTGMQIESQRHERNKWKMMIKEWNPVDLGLPGFPVFRRIQIFKSPKHQDQCQKCWIPRGCFNSAITSMII